VVVVDDVVGCVVGFLLLDKAPYGFYLEEVGRFLGNVNTGDVLG